MRQEIPQIGTIEISFNHPLFDIIRDAIRELDNYSARRNPNPDVQRELHQRVVSLTASI